MEPSRKLDALIAEKVMGLTVVAHDWPCGYTPDGCSLEASSFLPVCWDGFDSPGPVIAATDDGWPPEPDDEIEDGVYAFVEPVLFYSTDIAAAWTVVEKLATKGWRLELNAKLLHQKEVRAYTAEFDRLANNDLERVGVWEIKTAPLAICLAALKVCGVGIE